MPYIGSRVKRKEDVRLLRGIGKYVGDIHRPGMVHAAILRSAHAHARIVKIDTATALKLPGVIGVLTAADMPGLRTIPMRTGVIPGLERSQQTPIATAKVRYVGDPVAVVVADSRYIAEDALELIEVEYEALGAATDAQRACSRAHRNCMTPRRTTPRPIFKSTSVMSIAPSRLRLDLRRGIFHPTPLRRAVGKSGASRRVGRRPWLAHHVGTDQDDPHQLAHSIRADRPAAEYDPFY